MTSFQLESDVEGPVHKFPAALGRGTNWLRKLTAGLLRLAVGMILPVNWFPVVGLIMGLLTAEKSPPRIAAVGETNVNGLGDPRSLSPSQEKKKNELFFLMGPPRVAPNWLR